MPILPSGPTPRSPRAVHLALASLLAASALPTTLAAQAPGQDGRAAGEPRTFSPELAMLTFDSVWSRVANTHYDPDMGGVDWVAVRTELEPRARASNSNAELREVLRDMVGRLELSHFGVFAAEEASALAGEDTGDAPGSGGQSDPGLDLRVVDGDLAVVRVREGSPAEMAGVRVGWTLRRVADRDVTELPGALLPHGDPDPSGAPAATNRAPGPGSAEHARALYLPSLALARLQGEAGTRVMAEFIDAGGEVRSLELERVPPPGEVVRFGFLPPLPVEIEDRAIALPGGGTVGWIRFSAWFPAMHTPLAEAVDRHRGASGIVLDLRGNPGGLGAMAMGVGGHFIDEALELGVMRTRDTSLRFVVNPQRVSPGGMRVTPYAGPVALLVDPLTASTSEIFAAGMQALGRAKVFGEVTAGQALPAVVISLPNGDRLMHVIADYTAPGELRLEGRGVLPDAHATPTLDAIRQGRDPVLDRALEWIAGASGPDSGSTCRPESN